MPEGHSAGFRDARTVCVPKGDAGLARRANHAREGGLGVKVAIKGALVLVLLGIVGPRGLLSDFSGERVNGGPEGGNILRGESGEGRFDGRLRGGNGGHSCG